MSDQSLIRDIASIARQAGEIARRQTHGEGITREEELEFWRLKARTYRRIAEQTPGDGEAAAVAESAAARVGELETGGDDQAPAALSPTILEVTLAAASDLLQGEPEPIRADAQLHHLAAAREAVSAARHDLSALRGDRPRDPDLAAAEEHLAAVHTHLANLERDRRRELAGPLPTAPDNP